jgi:hypothetical protein
VHQDFHGRRVLPVGVEGRDGFREDLLPPWIDSAGPRLTKQAV